MGYEAEFYRIIKPIQEGALRFPPFLFLTISCLLPACRLISTPALLLQA
jgi:hypothetical protein